MRTLELDGLPANSLAVKWCARPALWPSRAHSRYVMFALPSNTYCDEQHKSIIKCRSSMTSKIIWFDYLIFSSFYDSCTRSFHTQHGTLTWKSFVGLIPAQSFRNRSTGESTASSISSLASLICYPCLMTQNIPC